MPQQTGSRATYKVADETVFGVANTGSAVRAFNLGYISTTLGGSSPLNPSAVLDGDRNASEPFTGSIDVSGDTVLAVDYEQYGLVARMAIDGSPTKNEIDVTTDVNLGGDVTVAGGSGGFTFSVAQTTMALGDRVAYEDDSGNTIFAYVTTRTNDTTGTLSLERDALTDAPDTTGAQNVVFIATNLAETSPGDATLVTGTLTFATPQTNVAINQIVIMDIAGTVKPCNWVLMPFLSS